MLESGIEEYSKDKGETHVGDVTNQLHNELDGEREEKPG